MTVTMEELDRMFKAAELAEAAGLDANATPRAYNDFCAEADEALRQATERGRREGQG